MENLMIASEKLHQPPPKKGWLPSSAILYKWFALCAILTFAFASLTLWSGKWKTLIYLPALLTVAIAGLLFVDQYFIPLNGLLIKAAALHLDAGEQYVCCNG